MTAPSDPRPPHTGATSMRTDRCGTLRADDVGRTVTVCGWVAKRREHGEHLAFLDVRDHTGIVQCVVPGTVDVRSEYVVAVEGTVRLRPEGTDNPELPTGAVELGECTVTLLNAAEPPPFPVDDRVDVDEVIRLRHRFVDLRRPTMQANLRLRAVVNGALRTAMDRQGFVEVETPLLWAPTPEGAREFAVPSRLHHGSCYVLPQSPQLAKQLLMVAGVDRYYQIARCLRDEDLRADIQSRIFAALGIGEEEAAARFGFLLGAFRFGAPPHAGFAVGLDRLVAIFAGEDNIREVIAFPKTQSGWDPMTDAPKPLAPGALADLGLQPVPTLD